MLLLSFLGVEETAKTFKIISKILSFLSVFVVVALAILLLGTRLVGFTPYTVLSGSMEPTYHVGSVVYVTDVEPSELRVEDCITYKMQSGTIVTHRIKDVIKESDGTLSFRTKGDANPDPDGILPQSAVIGKTVFSVPYLGYLFDFVKRPIGLIVVVGGCVGVFLLSLIIDLLFSHPEKSKNEDDNQQNESEDLS